MQVFSADKTGRLWHIAYASSPFKIANSLNKSSWSYHNNAQHIIYDILLRLSNILYRVYYFNYFCSHFHNNVYIKWRVQWRQPYAPNYNVFFLSKLYYIIKIHSSSFVRDIPSQTAQKNTTPSNQQKIIKIQQCLKIMNLKSN